MVENFLLKVINEEDFFRIVIEHVLFLVDLVSNFLLFVIKKIIY